jgi:hypothetical protein
MFSSTTIPQSAAGAGGQVSNYCEANSTPAYGVSPNLTVTEGLCLVDNTIWYDPNPEEKLWG